MSKQTKQSMFLTTAIIALVIAGGVALYTHDPARASAAEKPAAAPAAMPVQAEVIKTQPVQIWKDFSGRLQAVDFAQIKPQVGGRITEIRFKDGQIVNKGDILMVIDPRTYQAAVDQASADVTATRNQLILAQKELRRAEDLTKTSAIPQRVYDERANTVRVTKASLDSAQARLEQAQINLDFAYVKAPIAGRVSRAEITVGNLVDAGANAPVLTSIVSNDGIYANFEVDEQTYMSQIHGSARDLQEENKIPVRMTLANSDVAHDGFIQSFDNQINVSSGTIRARAFFDNKDNTLLPGMFVSVKMGSPLSQEKIMLSERAISTDQDRKFVYVISPENKATYRSVTIGDSVDGKRVILSGLKDGDRVITDGIIRIRPDMPVTPQIVTAASLPAITPEQSAAAADVAPASGSEPTAEKESPAQE